MPSAVTIVIDNDFVSFPAALVAFTVKVNFPVAVGDPEITPVVSARIKPVGNEPLSRLHVIPPPVAASVWLYAVCAVPSGNVAVVISGVVTIVIDNDFVSLPLAFSALTVKLDVPAVIGVPVIAFSTRSKPAGNDPPSRLHVMGVSPVAESVWLYAVSTTPFGNAEVVIAGVPAAAIAMDNCLVALPAALVAFTVKVDVSASVGFPEITAPLRVKPAGNAPLAMLHVMGASPVAASVWLYAVPTVPPGIVVAVLIAGATPFLPSAGPSPSLQAAKENPITAIKAISPNVALFIKYTPMFYLSAHRSD
jgi:hypothetical protein